MNRTLSRYYDESQNLIRQENHVTVLSDTVEVPEDDENTEEENPTAVNETLEDYTEVVVNEYDAKGRNICTRSYIEGQQDTAGVVVKETIYNEKGGVIETATYNSLDPTSKFREKQELSEDGRVTGVWDETGLYKTAYEYRADRAAVRHVISPNGAKQAYESDNYSDVEVNSVSTEDGEENSTRKKYDCGLLTELHSGSNDVRYTYDLRRRIADVFINSETPIVSHHHVENSLYNGKSVNDCRTAMANGHVIGVYTRKGDDAVLRTTSSMNGKTWVSKYNYDNLDRLTDKTVTREGIGTVLEKEEYSYDSCNRTTAYTHTMNGIQDESENYLYNTRGELISKEVNVLDKALVFNYERDDTPARELTSVSVNGLTVCPKTDGLGRNIGKRICSGSSEIASEQIAYRKEGDCATAMPSTVSFGKGGFLSYTYDEMGNIRTISENGRLIARYSYDRIGRLCREDDAKSNKTTTCIYDNNGNILFRFIYPFTLDATEYLAAETPEESHVYSYDGDRMISYDGASCTYDVMGCPTVYRGHGMTWGEYCRPLSYALTNGETVTYTYDVGGRRIGKNDLRFVYGSDGSLLAQSNGMTFLYDTAGTVGFTYGEETYLYRKNAQGDVIALLNTAGQVVATYVYDAWGNHRVFNAEGIDITNDSQYNTHVGNLNPIRYRSYYFDTETGLYWLTTRFYDPETGRFISQDEYSYLDPDSINGLNLFAYCGNNPVMLTDNTGCSWWNDFWSSTAGKVIGTILVVAAVVVLSVVTAGVGAAVTTALGSGLAAAIVGGAVGGAISGTIISAGISMIGQGISNGYANINYGLVGISALSGAASGALFGAVFGGISYLRAVSFLRKSGVTDIKGTLQAFKGTPRVRTLSKNTIVRRISGGESGIIGKWVSPNNYGANARNLLALPDGNTASKVTEFIIAKGTKVLEGKAAGLFGYSGGGIQYVVDIWSLISNVF